MTEQDQIDIIRSKLSNRHWRLNHLYWIKDKRGNKIRFRFNKFQEYLYKNLWFLNIILKARQLGITTFFSILYLDAILFKKNQTAGIIAHTEKDAQKIFRDKVKFAFDNLPVWLKDELEIETDSLSELSFKNGSLIFVTTSTRSGTVQYLHISEFGRICQKYPEKAEEIVTGAINAVAQGCHISIESTAKGRSGRFYDFCQEAIKNQKIGKKLTPLEFRFFFFPWYENEEYILNSNEFLTKETEDYFVQLQTQTGIVFSQEQKIWYQSKRKIQKENMLSEYPSTPEEAFMGSIEGAYYSKYISKTFDEKRITNVPYDERVMVDTWWDLGMNDFNVILFTQFVGKEIRFIDLYYNHGEGLSHYAKVLKDKPYVYRNHYLPHDVEVRDLSMGVSRKDVLYDLGVRPIYVIPRIGLQEGIEMVRGIFSRFWIDRDKCSKLVDACVNYRKAWDEKLGQFKSDPVHDDHSHFTDALRGLAVCYNENITYNNEDTYNVSSEEFNKYSVI